MLSLLAKCEIEVNEVAEKTAVFFLPESEFSEIGLELSEKIPFPFFVSLLHHFLLSCW